MTHVEERGTSRRRFIKGAVIGGVALGGATVLGGSQRALARPAALDKVFGGRKTIDGAGKVRIKAPAIAENGRVVPITISGDDNLKTKAVYLVIDNNPVPLATKLNTRGAAAFLSTNARMRETSIVRGIVELQDGTLLETSRPVKVTIGGCGG